MTDDDLSGPRSPAASPVASGVLTSKEAGKGNNLSGLPSGHKAHDSMGLGVSGHSYAELQLSVVIVMDFGLSLRMLSFNSNSILEGEVRDSRNRDMIATGEQGSSPANNRQAKITYTGRRLE